MSEPAANQLRRILHMVPQLADGEPHGIDVVAAHLGVDRKTLLADLVSLMDRFEEPGGFVDGVSLDWDDKHVSVLTRHFLRPMRLTMQELCALELGLTLLRRERAPHEWAVIDRALARLREVITRLPTNDRLVGVMAAEHGDANAEQLDAARRAVQQHRKLRIRYQGGSADEASERTICPYSLVFAQGMWYVIAFCEQHQGLRFFRLDRLRAAVVLDDAFTPPSDFSVDDVLASNKAFRADSAATMKVRYSPRIARWIAEREGVAQAPDGSLVMEHPLADEHWAIRHVLQYGPDAEVLEPTSLRDAVAGRLAAMSGA